MLNSKNIKNIVLLIVIIVLLIVGYKLLAKKSPEQIELEQKIENFEIEGRDHVSPETVVEYKTNPPTSGGHLGRAQDWGVYSNEIDDKAAVHGLEHGGIWITYKDLDDEAIKSLEKIGKDNSQSVIVSPRFANDVKIAVVSWGKMMKLESVDSILIQKYIDTYKNQSPERLAN